MPGVSVGTLIVAVAAGLASCASRPITYMPDGRAGYGVTCNRFYESWSSCLIQAGRLCGSRGYTTYYSDEVNRELIVGCKAAVPGEP
jgi:hypothetical protein